MAEPYRVCPTWGKLYQNGHFGTPFGPPVGSLVWALSLTRASLDSGLYLSLMSGEVARRFYRAVRDHYGMTPIAPTKGRAVEQKGFEILRAARTEAEHYRCAHAPTIGWSGGGGFARPA